MACSYMNVCIKFYCLYQTSTPQFEVEAPKLICPDAQLGSALGRSSLMLNASSTTTSMSPPQVIR